MTKKQIIFFVLFLVVVTGTSFFYWKTKWSLDGNKKKNIFTQKNNQVPNTPEPVEDVYTVPVAVVVENYPDARPQSGLIEADVVYETVAEGGITRFLVIYKHNKAENIGPIRSARTYFAELANELGVIFAHVGGNSDVLQELRGQKYFNLINLDQFFWEKYFQRIASRKIPHNVFSSTEVLSGFLKEQNKNLRQAEKLPVTEIFTGEAMAKKITIDFSLKDYLVEYLYNEQLKTYERSLAGKPHIDAETKKVLSASNVIIQYVKTWPVKSDTPFSISMDLENGGKAVVFAEGKSIEGKWKKTDRTRYFNSQDQEISIVPGQTWVELVPEDRKGFVLWQ